MNESVLLFSVITTLLYAVGTVGFLIYVIRTEKVIHRIAYGFLLAGFVSHTLGLAMLVSQLRQMPVTTLPQTFSLFAWAIVGSYLAFQLKFNIRILGTFVSPLAVVFMLLSSAIPGRVIPNSQLFKSFWLTLHVATMFIGMAIFALAFCAGIMYLLQERQIKSKSFGLLYRRLPSLEVLDSLNYVCLTFGFPLITIGLISGFVYAGAVWQSFWHWDPKEILSVVTWLIYAVLLHERLAVGWRGRRAAIMAIIGFSVILVTFVGTSVILEVHHSFKLG
ncbi:MAG: cytochrome c biogenesis protein [Deltaproteobacteria bacterium]|nr:cytochrome c biogenesis protein [Deltaproteobacteria bacterium]MDH3800943.1 cytochrome c biogenesis protein [Deltaproteobacteria bacterium]MDH3850048.1 cytochrome c biogenesis protein [Deltaproteobacteria bacterium]MDH3895863.1 cytochrome c biogenesis protein [Deltaproteobacteria bacterium]MDH3927415.1 cytochrome c biogenesis protein [Deltaproteobacteria bacterium]